MSTILKALRRLEQDKAREESQNLEESVAAAEVRSPRRGTGWRLALVAFCILLGAGSGALVAWFWLPRDESSGTARVAVTQPVATAPARGMLPPVSASPSSEEPAGLVVEESVPPDEPPVVVLQRAVPGGAAEETPEPDAADTGGEAAGTSTARRLQRTEIESRVLAERAERAAAPIVVRPRVPELIVTRTVWHPDSQRRTAVVQVGGHPEPVLLGEGDSIGSLTVLEITPSGVNFDHGGVQLYKRVGSGG